MGRPRKAPSRFQPSWIQHTILSCLARIVCACLGRRVGKTWIGAHWVIKRVHRRMDARIKRVQAGEVPRWPGEGKPARVARFIQPDVLAWIVAPAERHLDEARGYMLQHYAQAGWDAYLHPAFPGGIYNRGQQLWLQHCGVCARIDFIPASGESRLVGKGIDVLWIDEAGFVDNARFQALKPATMDRKAEILASGTPSLGDDHWFTRLAQSGLPEGHERAAVGVDRNPEVETFIGDTITHAALPEAREEAAKEAAFWGPRWAAQWIYADWRQRGRHVYDEWSPDAHVADYRIRGAAWWLGRTRLPRPDEVLGLVDWTLGSAPGASVVLHIWRNNPLSPDDPRPLVVQVDEHQGYDPYTEDGWWGILRSQGQRWGVDRWIGDPHAPELIERAYSEGGIWVEPGPHADKAGRIRLVAGLLHWSRGDPVTGEGAIRPALYVSRRCEHALRQFANYSWKVNRDGELTDQPKQYDDHVLDCHAMAVAEIGAGAVWIGQEAFG